MPWRAVLFVLLGLSAAGLLSGCGPATATISGEVKVNGALLQKGVISFVPADNTGAPVTAEITNGKYEVKTTAGKKFVQISAPVVTGKRKESPAENAPMIEITTESLPAKYHSKTELTFDVQPGGNTKNWDLEAKKK